MIVVILSFKYLKCGFEKLFFPRYLIYSFHINKLLTQYNIPQRKKLL